MKESQAERLEVMVVGLDGHEMPQPIRLGGVTARVSISGEKKANRVYSLSTKHSKVQEMVTGEG